jgi:hypothetical protein
MISHTVKKLSPWNTYENGKSGRCDTGGKVLVILGKLKRAKSHVEGENLFVLLGVNNL